MKIAVKQTEYDKLELLDKIKHQAPSLYSYLLNNHKFNPEKSFYAMDKEELLTEFLRITQKHIKLLENI